MNSLVGLEEIWESLRDVQRVDGVYPKRVYLLTGGSVGFDALQTFSYRSYVTA